jgi:hypothetical protein
MSTLGTFTPTTDLGNNKKGLKKATHSFSTADITGSGFTNASVVMVTYTSTANPRNSRRWEGVLAVTSNGGTVSLECFYNGPLPEPAVDDGSGVGDPEDVTVTVTVGDSGSITPTITIGP